MIFRNDKINVEAIMRSAAVVTIERDGTRYTWTFIRDTHDTILCSLVDFRQHGASFSIIQRFLDSGADIVSGGTELPPHYLDEMRELLGDLYNPYTVHALMLAWGEGGRRMIA
jgi:hypothetical protein